MGPSKDMLPQRGESSVMTDGTVDSCSQTPAELETADLRVTVCPCTPPIVEICGEIDIQSAPDLRDELLRVIRRRGSQLALDLAGVTFMDCAGINVLVATRRRAELEGGWMRVVRASPGARRTISLLGLEKAFALGAWDGEPGTAGVHNCRLRNIVVTHQHRADHQLTR